MVQGGALRSGGAALRGSGLAQFAGSFKYSTHFTNIWALLTPPLPPIKKKKKSEYSLRPISNPKELSETKKNVTNF